MPPPNPRFDVSQTPDFEGPQLKEDRIRARMLRKEAKRDPANSQALLALAARIDPEGARNPETLASSRYMRGQRVRIITALWQLIYEA